MNEEMTLGDWLLTLLLTCIPCVNIVMLCIWAFGNNGYATRKTWAQAQLIFVAIGFVLSFILGTVFSAFFASLIGALS